MGQLIRLPATCQRCQSDVGGQFKKQIFSNHGVGLVYVCKSCGKHMDKDRIFYPRAMLAGNIDNLPIHYDERIESAANPCSVKGCLNTDTELHHFAPREFWGQKDAEFWPKNYLCRYHHRLWHDVISGQKLYTGDSTINDYRASQGWGVL